MTVGPSEALLVGHPNVDKSVLFSRLTDATAVESKCPGTTVSYADALVVGVVDATRFERGLNVVLELVEREFEHVVAVNM
ncbi:GTPase [Halorubrum sp. BOL3-1]|uniref:GTPase n=1 Tax=Halorubrum sp. BOL3-1 TaxID=2497325 RepID=UPI0014080DE4|nr:GTPase [Halorubrum sp. BOL3-1]